MLYILYMLYMLYMLNVLLNNAATYRVGRAQLVHKDHERDGEPSDDVERGQALVLGRGRGAGARGGGGGGAGRHARRLVGAVVERIVDGGGRGRSAHAVVGAAVVAVRHPQILINKLYGTTVEYIEVPRLQIRDSGFRPRPLDIFVLIVRLLPSPVD